MNSEITPVYIRLNEVDSTNNWLKANGAAYGHGTVVTAAAQTAGRGQRGNSWESLPGANITMSMLIEPRDVTASQQFAVSEVVSLAVVDTLREFLGDDAPVAVKWPNDIYWNDRKICGILIENVLCGTRILRSVVGIGLNVNQREFLSDAPNPVSMYQIAGHEFDVEEVLQILSQNIMGYCGEYLSSSEGMEQLHGLYMRNLWRREGLHPYRDTATGRTFNARIAAISPEGLLTLEEPDGHTAIYAFKEVKALIEGREL